MSNSRQIVGWYDPVLIHVAWDVLRIRWSWDWNCVYFIEGEHIANWLTSTGWSLLAMYTYPLVFGVNQNWLQAQGYSFYQNTTFRACTSTVNASVRMNRIIGDEFGTAYFAYDADLAGPACTALLFLWVDQDNSL